MSRETALFVIMLIGAAGAVFDLRTGYLVVGIAYGALHVLTSPAPELA